MLSRSVLMCVHSYTPFGQEFYLPILDFQLATMRKYKDEFDTLYLIEDDNWKLTEQEEDWIKIIHVDSSKRYYDCYKEVLPQVKEDLVLFMDDDMIIYQSYIIQDVFDNIDAAKIDIVSIADTIGTYRTDKLFLGNKLCPYWFGARKEVLLKYLDIDWGPNMPYTETFGLLTEALVKDGVRIREVPDDKSSINFDGTEQYPEQHTTAGLYHIRAGSTPAYLLATDKYGDRKTYEDYLKNQPQSELLRQCAWHIYMGGDPFAILLDLKIDPLKWKDYYHRFKTYHGLI